MGGHGGGWHDVLNLYAGIELQHLLEEKYEADPIGKTMVSMTPIRHTTTQGYQVPSTVTPYLMNRPSKSLLKIIVQEIGDVGQNMPMESG